MTYACDGYDKQDAQAQTTWNANGQGYPLGSGGPSGNYNSNTSGSVTATCTWTHEAGQDDTSDPAPAHLYVAEAVEAHAEGNYTTYDDQGHGTQHTATLAVDDGSGDPITTTSDQYGNLSIQDMAGTHYQALDNSAHADVIPLAAHSLSASASWTPDSSSNGSTYASVSYGATPITLSILRDGIDVTDPLPAKDVYVGERVRLSAQITPNNLPVTNDSQRWNIPGDIFYDWTAGLYGSAVLRLSAIHDQPSVNYCWNTVSGAAPGTTAVSVTYTIPLDTITLTATAKFNVVRPSASLNGNIPFQVSLGQGWDRAPGSVAVHLGDSTQNPGIIFHNSPPPEAGEFELVQLVSTVRKLKTQNGTWYGASPNQGLDAPPEVSTWEYPFTDAAHTEAVDYPGLNLEGGTIGGNAVGFTDAHIADSFSMYLMFRPLLPPDSAYVPIKLLNWDWSVDLTRPNNAGNWEGITSAITHPGLNATNEGAYTTSHPYWNQRLTGQEPYIPTTPP